MREEFVWYGELWTQSSPQSLPFSKCITLGKQGHFCKGGNYSTCLTGCRDLNEPRIIQLLSGRASVRSCVGTCLHFSEILLPGASLPPFGWEELIPPSVWAEAVSERAHCPWPVSVFRQICFLSFLIWLLPALSCLIPSNLTSLLFFPLLALCLWRLLGKMNFVETDWGRTAESESLRLIVWRISAHNHHVFKGR